MLYALYALYVFNYIYCYYKIAIDLFKIVDGKFKQLLRNSDCQI